MSVVLEGSLSPGELYRLNTFAFLYEKTVRVQKLPELSRIKGSSHALANRSYIEATAGSMAGKLKCAVSVLWPGDMFVVIGEQTSAFFYRVMAASSGEVGWISSEHTTDSEVVGEETGEDNETQPPSPSS